MAKPLDLKSSVSRFESEIAYHLTLLNIMRKYRDYTDKDVIGFVKEVTSMAQLLKKLNLTAAGGNYDSMKKLLNKLNADTSHWKGQGWSSGQRLKGWENFKRADNLKPHLVVDRGNVCECCNLSTWIGEEIKLELHHVDGNRLNNSYKNLQLLCPNCHSYTDAWRVVKS